ncbi:DNA/RNA non-specific endonuclease [Chitinophaga filiformis]|uniref:DNA/RNA non-specific endonuclease n=1 Tax=Chitinophaga filiformis TaxID=104663 RepID=UPI001F19FDDA|nr:DNA/RNA non-specific endonuclease [Chitinophaga filiformis]
MALLASIINEPVIDGSARQVTRAPGAPPARVLAPVTIPKTREKEYDRKAVRGGRGKGQKDAMFGYSARDYVHIYNPRAAAAKSWEWLHIQGSRLGGLNRPENLVAGTAQANTQMIPYERAIFSLSKLSRANKKVKVNWSATLQNDSDGGATHIGNKITINVTLPPETGAVADPNTPARRQLASIFPVEINAVEGACIPTSNSIFS